MESMDESHRKQNITREKRSSWFEDGHNLIEDGKSRTSIEVERIGKLQG